MSSLSDREQLARLVEQWNENRLDLFHLSYPTEDLEIEGVMRFYFQDGGERVLTKCVRVSSTATTRAVVEALADKFLPDLKMLTEDHYTLWEVHENGDERRLDEEEKPLLVQLNWHKDDREGRFLLRRDRHPTIPLSTIQIQEGEVIDRSGQKRFSKREKKEAKKKNQQKDIVTVNGGREEATPVGELYRQVPPTTFTRTISNPEVVMKKRREKKLETKLKEMTGHGGGLKIYGGELVASKPYVTILVSIRDRVDWIIKETLEKYGLSHCNPDDFVLVEQNGIDSGNGEMDGRILSKDECPLMQMVAKAEDQQEMFLALRPRPSNYRVPSTVLDSGIHRSLTSGGTVSDPAFVFLTPEGIAVTPARFIRLQGGVSEVGSDRELPQYSPQNIYLNGVDVLSRHCVLTFTDGVVTLTPSASEAFIEVNHHRITQTAILRSGDIVRIGATNLFRFVANQLSPPQSSFSTAEYGSLPVQNMQQTASSGMRRYASTSGLLEISFDVGGSRTKGRPPSDSLTPSQLKKLLSGSSGGSRQPSDVMERGGATINSAPSTLPVVLQIGDYKVWDYLVEIMSKGCVDSGSFRLSPAYSLYLALRFFHSHSKPYLVQFFTRIAHYMTQISQECSSRDELLFWLANSSELTFLVERDPDLRTPRASQLGSVVEGVFRRLSTVLLGAIRPACQSIVDVNIPVEDGCNELISLLDNTLRAARTARLNAALTIQLASHMFHTINAQIFNSLIGQGPWSVRLTTRIGKCLTSRLSSLHRWAEQMGVELAAECHLDRSRQAAILLAAQKNDVAALGATCYKLNSLQVRYLLSHFVTMDGEIPCDNDVISRIVGLSERQADELTMQDGLQLTLEESDQLTLPFLLPQDGYTAEQLRGVPDGLMQYVYCLQDKGLCHSVMLLDGGGQTNNNNNTTKHHVAMDSSTTAAISSSTMGPTPLVRSVSQSTLTSIPTTQFGDSFGSNGDDIIRVILKRGGGGIGLSIVAAQGVGDRQVGIYVKKVVEGSPAAQDGRLTAGDQLLSVNGQSLLGISQEDAAQYMARSGAEVNLEVRKGAAHRNGLALWLGQGTPTGAMPTQPGAQIAPSPAMSMSQTSQLTFNGSTAAYNTPPNSSNYAPISKFGNQHPSAQPSVQSYQRNNQTVAASRSSAFAPPAPSDPRPSDAIGSRHVRSISASDLYQNDPNASFSQRSLASNATGTSGFDKLPAHYRHSSRPTVIQPGRPCPSPSALRRGAQSPNALYRPPSTNGLYRPPSATNLFAPPKSPNPLQQQGYSSNATRDSTHDIFRASMPSPVSHSSPREEYHTLPIHSASIPSASSYSASLPAPLNRPTYTNNYQSSSSTQVPRATIGPSMSNGYGSRTQGYSMTDNRTQEPVVVRPVDLGMTRVNVDHGESRQREEERPSTTFGVMRGLVPTAITQALQLQEANGNAGKVLRPPQRPTGLDRDLRELERNTAALMSRESLNDELDRLDSKGVHMTEEEKRRYRELLQIAADQSRVSRLDTSYNSPAPLAKSRTETLIDDIDTSPGRSALRENIMPVADSRKKSVQFKEEFADDSDIPNSPSIVGNNEIYRDPRQRRLNELQERQMQPRPDGGSLGFRDKMKMFATQLGENTPKTRYHASSAERQIQQE